MHGVIMAKLEFPLYHGTSTIFLKSIAQHGLGGWDPIKEWRVLECLRRVIPVAGRYADRSEFIPDLMNNAQKMADQVNSHMNFQHGAVYLSPAKQTAVRYACGKGKKGSELISRTVWLIEELVRLDISEVKGELYRDFPEIFDVMDINVAPVLIQVNSVLDENLLSESGESPAINLERVRKYRHKFPDSWEEVSQQCNFRLTEPIASKELDISLISVGRRHGYSTEYALLPIPLSEIPVTESFLSL